MTHTQSIPKAAFSEAMSAYRYFDKVDEGCGYDRLNAKLHMIRYKYNLTDEQLCVVQDWAHDKYYKA